MKMTLGGLLYSSNLDLIDMQNHANFRYTYSITTYIPYVYFIHLSASVAFI